MLRIFLLLLILKGTLMAIEEPKYTVIQKNDTFEIREYASFLVAQTEVTGSFDEMGGKAFRILFKYISGENQQRSNIKMTAPVIQENKKAEGQKIQMTAPVIQDIDAANPNSAIYSFVMPEEFTLDTLPRPLDKRITVKEIPAKRVAVRVFSGSWSKKNFKDNEAVLLNALKAAHIKTKGKTSFARYNSPFSLWFMRRNEVMIEVK
jgi:hypothetical protein